MYYAIEQCTCEYNWHDPHNDTIQSLAYVIKFTFSSIVSEQWHNKDALHRASTLSICMLKSGRKSFPYSSVGERKGEGGGEGRQKERG